MAINVYTGLMGSGKSYEVVSSVIVKALSEGRRVVSNIEGLQPDKIYEHIQSVLKKEQNEIGELVVVDDEEVKRASFFPTDDPERYSIVKGGDLVAIDEAWKFWPAGGALLPEHMEFFRKHRHYVHPETNVSCDLALMIQDITDLHKSLKNVVEMTFRTIKLKTLGLSKKYRVEFYEGTRLMKKNQIGYRVNSYDAKVFPLYQSYAGGSGKEKTVDDRQNLWKNQSLWWIVAFLVVLSVFAFRNLYNYFYPESAKKQKTVEVAKTTPGSIATPSTPAQSLPQQSSSPSNWRIVGSMGITEKLVILQNTNGMIRVEHPSMFQHDGLAQQGKIDGIPVFRYADTTVSNPGEKK